VTYILAPGATADLRGIVRYTRDRWGKDQARSYAAKIKRGIEAIATGRGQSKDVSELYPGLRVANCEHHYIFCLPQENAPALIVAILHERMDLITHIKGRLDP
jgi:toxin ParE1/3/4